MNDINTCGNHESLVTYLYDECEAPERQSMAAHVAVCASCAEELQALRDARVHLAAWSPPESSLGFQITRTEAEAPARVLRPAGLASRSSQSEGWWRQPLPAWAQAAAAAVIFAAGISLGAARSPNAPAAPAVAASPSAVVDSRVANMASRDDLRRLEARLQSVEREQSQQVSAPARTTSGTLDERALFERMSMFVDARMSQGDRQNLRLVAEEIDRLDGRYEQLSSRTDVLEQDSEAIRRVVNRFAPATMVRAASVTGGP